MARIAIPKTQTATVRASGSRVHLIIDGKLVGDLPYEQADVLGRVLRMKSKEAEENAKALDIINDQAVAMRAGVPLALSTDPRKLAQAKSDAQHRSDLRRYLPNSKGPGPVVFAPSVKRSDPK